MYRVTLHVRLAARKCENKKAVVGALLHGSVGLEGGHPDVSRGMRCACTCLHARARMLRCREMGLGCPESQHLATRRRVTGVPVGPKGDAVKRRSAVLRGAQLAHRHGWWAQLAGFMPSALLRPCGCSVHMVHSAMHVRWAAQELGWPLCKACTVSFRNPLPHPLSAQE